ATTIYVTHDQTEAMTLADRIVIMNATKNSDDSGTIGRIEQIGTPQELYNEPVSKFVASFIGSPSMNFFTVTVGENRITNQDGLDIAIPEGQAKILRDRGYLGKEVIFGIRPEDILDTNIAIEAYPEDTVTGEVVVSELLGPETMLYLKLGQTEYVARVSARDTFEAGDKVALTFNITKGHFFDLATEQAIR
ncbi:ABC transporter ATP-binding protein, partial [Aerococcus sp. L_32]